jgi:hypothetical protein|nr:MAG TPA: hypothetical protein [Caudoviricetes sp.]
MDIKLAEKYDAVALAVNLQNYIRIDHNEGMTKVLENILSGVIFTLVKTKGARFNIENTGFIKEDKDHSITKVVLDDKNTYLLFESLLLGFWNHFDFVRKGYTVHEYRLTKSKATNLAVLVIKLNKGEYIHAYTFIFPSEFIEGLPLKDLQEV